MTSFYIHDIILVLFQWIIRHDYKNLYLVTRDWSQSTFAVVFIFYDDVGGHFLYSKCLDTLTSFYTYTKI